jgi:hypothetical protein
MKIITEDDLVELAKDHPWSRQFTVLTYGKGGFSMLPNNFI